jgi:urease accessory protein
MADAAFLSLLQFADGLFPAGGFAHSLGLEAHCQAGIVRDRAGLEAFLLAHLEGAAGPCDAVALVCALRAAREGDLAAVFALDRALEAMKPVRALREASAQMGRETLRVAAALAGDARLAALHEAAQAGRTPGHHAIAFGAAGGVFGWTPEDAAAAFLHAGAAALVNAALRLIPLGQIEGQRAIAALRGPIAQLAAQAASARADDLASFAPALEVAGMRHGTLEGRLFRS